MFPIRPELEYRGLARFYERAEKVQAWDAEAFLEPEPAVSAWSAAEQLFHVGLANELALRNVQGLLDGRGRMIRPFESITDLAVDVLERGRYPRGESEAPRTVRPPKRVDPAILADILAGNRTALERLQPRLGEILDAPDVVPHHELGDLSAAQWLRFARMHAMHHFLIVRDIARARA